jgi:hypothetical protein
MVEECSHAAQVDGMARAHVRLVTAITVGAQEIDPEIECKDESARDRLDELLDTFWEDPVNDLATSLGEFMNGLTTTGSLCLTLHTGFGSRLTRIGYLDPASFASPGVLTDPANVRQPIAVLRGSWTSSADVVAHPIVQTDGSVHEMFAGKKEGAKVTIERSGDFGGNIAVHVGAPCIYLGINRVSPSQSVGISDLYPALDLMNLLDELVFGAVERSINLGAYSLHVKFPKGTPAQEIEARMNTIRGDLESGRGRAVGTTDDVSIDAVAAALQAGEWATLEKVARTNSLIALGPWPIHIFSEGAGTNVTVAAEQGSPVANFLLERQNSFRKFMVRLCMYALQQYPEARALIESNEVEIRFPLPVIVAKNTTRESNVLSVEANILATAEDRGWIKLEAAQREFADAAKRYGFEIGTGDIPDPAEVEEKRAMQALTLAPMKPDETPDPEDPEDPDADPRGGKREDDEEKVAEGTPAKAA